MSRGDTLGNKGGRPTREQAERKRIVAERVKAYLDRNIYKVLCAYLKTATGVKRRKFNPKTGQSFTEIEYSRANQRHWVDKFVPPVQKIEAIASAIVARGTFIDKPIKKASSIFQSVQFFFQVPGLR